MERKNGCLFLVLYLVIVLSLITIAATAQTYYVSNMGSDAANGLTPSTAWQTVGKVNGFSFASGDSILFKKGDTWREQLSIQHDSIFVSSYGTGALPKITANDIISSWTSETVNGIDFISTNTPLSYWNFEDATSPSLDATGNHNDFVWGGAAVRSSGHVEGNYSFSQGNTSGSLTSVPFTNVSSNFPGKGATTDFTIGFWCKLKTSWSIYEIVFGLSDKSSKGWYFSTNFDNKIRFQAYGVPGTRTILSDGIYLDGNWHHVVGRWQGSTTDELSLWIDGVKQSGVLSMSSLTLVTASSLTIKRGDLDNVDEAFVYSTALTDDQIYSLYSHGLNGVRNPTTVYYSATSANPFTVIRDDTLIGNVGSIASLKAGRWCWANNRTYLFDNPSGHVLELGARPNAVNTNSKNWVTVKGLELQGGNSKLGTFRISGSHDITIDSNYIHNVYSAINNASGGNNVVVSRNYISRGYGFGYVMFNLPVTGCALSGNTIHDFGNLSDVQVIGTDNSCGIFADLDGKPIVIDGNNIYNIALNFFVLKQGIYIDHAPKSIIRSNVIKDCGFSGIKISSHSDSTYCYGNAIYHCSTGINVVGSVGVRVNNNTITGADNLSRAGFTGYGIYVATDFNEPGNPSSIIELKNNIITNNLWTGVPIRQIYVADNTCTLSGSDYNIIWSATGNSGTQINYRGTGYTFAQWQATGQDVHSINADPLLSPAIDAGINVGLPYFGAPDIGAYQCNLIMTLQTRIAALEAAIIALHTRISNLKAITTIQ